MIYYQSVSLVNSAEWKWKVQKFEHLENKKNIFHKIKSIFQNYF